MKRVPCREDELIKCGAFCCIDLHVNEKKTIFLKLVNVVI